MAYVIDASALLALLQNEPGAQRVEELIESVDSPDVTAAYLSTVNLTELHQLLGPKIPESLVGGEGSVIQAMPYTAEHARTTAGLQKATKKAGLSLADRACLALAIELGLPAITADRAWSKVAVGVELEVIR